MPASASSGGVLLPVDEAVSRPDFLAFRTQLTAAIAQRDASAIYDVVHPNIKNSFGGDDGIDEFKRMWRLEESNLFWNEFGNVLRLGGSFDNANEFTAPYTFSRWPNDMDSFDYVAVVGTRVRVRTLPRLDARIGGAVSHEILQLDMEAFSKDWRTEEWTAVRIDGRKMYIATRFIRRPIELSCSFSAYRWQVVAQLLSGRRLGVASNSGADVGCELRNTHSRISHAWRQTRRDV